jgi:hypothetical protein
MRRTDKIKLVSLWQNVAFRCQIIPLTWLWSGEHDSENPNPRLPAGALTSWVDAIRINIGSIAGNT